MAVIITVPDLPTALQGADMIETMVDGANAKASRVAPCLVAPTSTAWVTATAYAVGDQVKLTGPNEYLEATVAGTSGATAPAAPSSVGGTITDGSVTWSRTAPTPDGIAEAKLILLGAVKRWVEAGSGAVSQQTAGPFGVQIDTRQKASGFNLWASEVTGLQAICSPGPTGRQAFSLDTAPACSAHLPWCSLMLGALYCSCGVDIAGYPIYELG